MAILAASSIVAFIATEDRSRARTFYHEQLGLPLVSEDAFAIVFDAHGTMLRLTPVQKSTVAPYTVLGWEVEDIAATAKELQQAGVTLERFAGLGHDEHGIWTAPGGDRVGWFKDPDGNVLSVTQHK